LILTYSEPFDRPRAHVTPADIQEALKFFGPGVRTIMVNPSILPSVENAVPEDIELLPHPGCASWEIYGEIPDKQAVKPDVAKIIDTLPVPEIPNIIVTIAFAQPVEYQRRPVVRPPKAGTVSRYTEWRRKKKMQGKLL
jgi:hypothetical protein